MSQNLQQRVERVGLFLGPVLALGLYLVLPETYADPKGKVVAFSQAGRATLAMMAWMATWWMTEAVDIEVTALLPIAAFPLAGILPLARTTANYGADVIFLFLGGFVLALAIQRWGSTGASPSPRSSWWARARRRSSAAPWPPRRS